MNQHHFIEPMDVLYLRGNKLFGDPGSYGESLVPPWPSVVAGAIRSALLVGKGVDLARFAADQARDDELGTPSHPGPFRVTGFQLARRLADGTVEPLYPVPADLVVTGEQDRREIRRMQPWQPANGLVSSAATACLSVLPETERGKPIGGLWLTTEGWRKHLGGKPIDTATQLLGSDALWQLDSRIGIGLNAATGSVADGKLFTVQAVAFNKLEHNGQHDLGFLASVESAQLPGTLGLRLGGDGRGALASRVDLVMPEPDYQAIAAARRCRIVLTSPGLFAGGWRPSGVSGEGPRFDLGGISGQLVCAAVSRSEVVSGWDLARRRPKDAERCAPAGSVYWLQDLDATPVALRKLAAEGLWAEPGQNPSRRAEGFNRFTFAIY